MTPLEEFDGKSTTYHEKCSYKYGEDDPRTDPRYGPMGFYHGIKTQGGKQWVISGPEITFRAEQKEEKPKQARFKKEKKKK